jgi:hypothetical protein
MLADPRRDSRPASEALGGISQASRFRKGALARLRQDNAVAFQPARDVRGSELLTRIFHGWPSFHDAEIVRVSLQRERQSASLECVIHVFATAGDLDADGHFTHSNHTLATIRFDGIELQRLEEFNHQNVIDALNIESRVQQREKRFVVDMPANNGCDARFLCDAIRVISVEPYTIEQRIRDESIYVKR